LVWSSERNQFGNSMLAKERWMVSRADRDPSALKERRQR